MAPPIPGLRRPVQVPTRTAGDVLVGILAIAALAALTIGVPIALITVIGLPLPHATPGLSVLTHQIDIPSILRVLSVVIWLAWLQLVWCVIVEIQAAVRNVGVPRQVPLAGATQSAAHRLVTAALLLFTAGAALSPAFAHASTPRAQHTAGSVLPSARGSVQPGAQTAPPEQAAQPAIAQAPNVDKVYVVKPPAGRYHESLWEIAENHLGDGRRYREIFEMNKDHPQPDGTKLTIASLIRPGWTLRMPRDAYGPGIESVTQPTAPGAGQDGTGVPAGAGSGTSGNGAGAGAGLQQDGGAGGAGAATGTGTVGAGATNESVRAGNGTLAAPGQPGPGTPVFPYELSAASLLAAGVLSALGRRRREQLWRRAFGQRIAAPEGEAAVAESALRIGADEPSVQLLDLGLRYLSRALAAEDKPLPTVFAAHIGPENLDLWVAPADPSPPGPWTAADGGQVWRLPLAAVARLDLDASSGVLAPYPGLVSIGTNETGRILVDLEVAHGLIAVRGPHRPVQAALAALAVELATNRWSDRMRITLIGFGEELVMLAPERVTAVATLDEALPAMEARAAEVEQALASAGSDSGADRAVPDHRRGRLGAALPDHGRAADADAAGAAARAGPDPAPDRGRRRRRRRHAGRDLDLGGHRGRAPQGRRARLRPQGGAAPGRPVPRGRRAVPFGHRGSGRPAARPVGGCRAGRAARARLADAGGDRAARPGAGPRARPDRGRPAGAGHRAHRLSGHASRRRAPQRADRGDLAARRPARGAGRDAGPGPGVAGHRRRGPAQPDH